MNLNLESVQQLTSPLIRRVSIKPLMDGRAVSTQLSISSDGRTRRVNTVVDLL